MKDKTTKPIARKALQELLAEEYGRLDRKYDMGYSPRNPEEAYKKGYRT